MMQMPAGQILEALHLLTEVGFSGVGDEAGLVL
jgi:hypothetical protein